MPISKNQVLKSIKKICGNHDASKSKGSIYKLFRKSCDIESLTGLIINDYGSQYPKHKRMEGLKTFFKKPIDSPENEVILLKVLEEIADFIIDGSIGVKPPKKVKTRPPRKKGIFEEGERLALMFDVVRESSLKRFNQVAPADRDWRPSPNQLSFVDILKHLMDADSWIIAVLKDRAYIPKADIKPGDGKADEWDQYLRYWAKLATEKTQWLRNASEKDLYEDVYRAGNESKWFVLMRKNLDHEIHHRGALQVMLRLKYNP